MDAATEPTRAPLAVTIVAHDVGPVGGMERQLSELICGLLARGTRVTVVSRTCELEPHPHLRWVRVPGPARPFVLAYPWFFVVGSLLVWRHRRGVLHTTGAIVFNRAAVCTVHFSHEGGGRALNRARRDTLLYRINGAVARPLSRFAERLLYRPRWSATLVAVSRGLADELRARSPVVVISNGVDRERFRPDSELRASGRRELGLTDDDLLALFVGNEWKGKGLALAIDGIARTTGWRLAVVGDGDRTEYERRAPVGRILFLGERHDVERWYASADVLVAPSAYETFSFAVHEAAAAGLPVIASRVHGVDELLGEGVVARDAGAIAAALDELADTDVRVRAGEAVRAAVAGLTWDNAVDAYLRLYAVAA